MNRKTLLIASIAFALALPCTQAFADANNERATQRPNDPSMTPSGTARPTDPNGDTYVPGSSGPDSATQSMDRPSTATELRPSQNPSFTSMDTNGDGSLDRDELAGNTSALDDYDTLDSDGDAKISNREWASYDADRSAKQRPQ